MVSGPRALSFHTTAEAAAGRGWANKRLHTGGLLLNPRFFLSFPRVEPSGAVLSPTVYVSVCVWEGQAQFNSCSVGEMDGVLGALGCVWSLHPATDPA